MNKLNELKRELMNLCLKEETEKISGPHILETMATAILAGERAEKMVVFYLDARNNVIKHTISNGTVDHVIVYVREVAREALLCDATAIVMAHNHPSGGSTPSANDITITDRLKKAVALFDIKLLDHMVITDTKEENFSFAKNDLL